MAMVARDQNPIQHLDKQSVCCSIQVYCRHHIMYTHVMGKELEIQRLSYFLIPRLDMIINKNKINKRRFGKKAVREIIVERNLELDVDLTNQFEEIQLEEIGSPLIYFYEDNRFYVHGCSLIAGKGDVFSLAELEKSLKSYRGIAKVNEKMEKIYEENNGAMMTWDVFSRFGSKMIDHIPFLLDELADYLDVSGSDLDRSYKSLDLISEKINIGDSFENVKRYYDSIYIYVGEVFKERSNGEWLVDKYSGIPYVDIGVSTVSYNPMNVIGELMTGSNNLDLRLITINEYKSFSKRLKYEVECKKSR